ncbi:hypothetical protein L2E82_48517 [Cichorium intybus]|uniref:Uncharacterized protein n=1 Tax=Cichorium intybus TaxID=13427 RepID=A0ACB8YZ34_CICIN|nr:hypothetical protein L2E82_48517 [Cichorium intybus]
MAAAAVSVFGKPINHGTRAQRALAAKNNQNADGKLDQALLFLNQQQKAAAGKGNESTTFGNIYNATGGKITYVTAHDWSGKVVEGYPVTIQNGQRAVFKHVGTGGSVGAVVYNIQNIAESLVAWHATPPTRPGDGTNSAYCEMNDPRGFDDCNWDVTGPVR